MKFNFHLLQTLTFLAPLTFLGDVLGTHAIFNVLFGTPHCSQKQMFRGYFQCPLMFFLLCFLATITPLVIQKYIKNKIKILTTMPTMSPTYFLTALASSNINLMPLTFLGGSFYQFFLKNRIQPNTPKVFPMCLFKAPSCCLSQLCHSLLAFLFSFSCSPTIFEHPWCCLNIFFVIDQA